ncbi:MAG: flagellar hook-basal body complex protein FliE [Syntrophales bacterium]|nr:flagellar hook-basal body complex protein FliE [Syntrophales bacterium]
MDDLMIKKGVNPMVQGGAASAPGKAQGTPGGSFAAVLKGKISEINELQHQADKAIAGVMLEDSQSIHQAVIALEKANVSFRTMMEVRNKIVEAYQEVMRMQV